MTTKSIIDKLLLPLTVTNTKVEEEPSTSIWDVTSQSESYYDELPDDTEFDRRARFDVIPVMLARSNQTI